MSEMFDALDAVFENVSVFFNKELQKKIRITKIDPNALNSWKETWKEVNDRKPPNGGWDWAYKTSEARKKYTKYLIGIAVWDEGNSLCGLALCSKSKGNEVLSIHYIEGAPDKNHSLKGYVFKIINTILLEYGCLIKANKIRIMQPVDGLKDFYCSCGYVLNRKRLFGQEFCERGILK